MLVLSRQRDESIIISDNIVITIVDIRGDKVRLGITAPTEIPVHRQEVYEAIQRENLKASRLQPKDANKLERHYRKRRRPQALGFKQPPLRQLLRRISVKLKEMSWRLALKVRARFLVVSIVYLHGGAPRPQAAV